MPGTSGRGHRNARLTLHRLLDQCDFAMAVMEEPTVTLARLKQTIIEDFGGDIRDSAHTKLVSTDG